MKLLIAFLFIGVAAKAQLGSPADSIALLPVKGYAFSLTSPIDDKKSKAEEIKLTPQKWRMTGNRWLTGSLVFVAGASKGFNETLQFHWKAFRHSFPKANAQWFNPAISWRNKYKNGDPDAGPKHFLSTSALVMFTDQYHLNTFINRAAWSTAVVIKIGEGKKPFKHYVMDFVYYTLCHQAGFAATYYPFKGYREH
ncbi:MAG TPA: hypothetical protein VHM26_16515 [Chitinophagaceae bacterium]|jgi:hypothetical protein|nr:hypothetical protein [Chitinophagaceae bacterium]